MWYIVVLLIGIAGGYAASGLLSNNSNIEKMQKAYNQGFKDGRDFVLNDVNNLYDKYKNMINES